MMELALAHLGPSWLIALYCPAEHRSLDRTHEFASAQAALSYVTHWTAQGATIRAASQGAYAALVEEAAQGAGVVRVVGE